MGMNGMNQMGNMGMNDMNQMNNMGMNGMNQMGNMGMNGMNQMGMNGMASDGQMHERHEHGNATDEMGMGMMNQMGNMGMPDRMSMYSLRSSRASQMTAWDFTGQENIGLIKDVPLEVTVELGRTTKSISDILDFSRERSLELDRIAGEPIDVLVNGKFSQGRSCCN